MEKKKVVIIGGGISGLSAAWELQQSGGGQFDLTILEAGNRWGGKVLTLTMPAPDGGQFIIDAGPESFVTRKPEAWQLASELGLHDEVINPGGEASGTYVLTNGKPIALPLSPIKFITSPLLTPRGKLRMLAEPFIPPKKDDGDESLADFVTRRLGREALEKFIGPVLGGIYNTNPETQSILVTSPIMRELESYGSLVKGSFVRARQRKQEAKAENPPPYRFIGFRTGAERLVEALVSRLDAEMRLNTAVSSIHQPDNQKILIETAQGEQILANAVIIATPANVAAKLLQKAAPEAAAELAAIRHANIGTISLAYPKEALAHTEPMRGLMIPRREKRRIDAVTWTSGKIPDRAPEGYTLIRVFFGGGYPDMATMPEDDLAKIVMEELRELLNVTAEPIGWRAASWPNAYPQADVGHLARVARIESLLPAGLFVTGSSYRGLAVPDCIKQSRATAVTATKALLNEEVTA